MKVLIWQVSEDTAFKDKALKILEQQNDGIEVVGSVTGNDFRKVDLGEILLWNVSNDASSKEKAIKILGHNGTEIIDPTIGNDLFEIAWGGCSVILAVGAKKIGMNKVTQDALKLNLPEEKLLGDWIVCIPGFTLEKYRHLQRSRLSIIAMNCFGGLISHTLGLSFRSPIINMFFNEQGYLRFLSNSQTYMKENLTFNNTSFDKNVGHDYPVVKLGDVFIFMNHYRNFDEVVTKWNERKQKINWYNLFVTMYTEREKTLQEFDALPYGKKVCFVPFKSDLDSAWYIDTKIMKNFPFWDVVNHFAMSAFICYDLFDMLLYGKKTPLIDM